MLQGTQMKRFQRLAMMAICGAMVTTTAVQAQCSGGNCGGGAVDSFGMMAGGQVQPLFNNYFTQGYANEAEAGLYIAPHGVPGWVGHTYYTYQPFYPHQMLYSHHDRYHSHYDNGRGMNRTSAHYYYPPVRTGVKRIYKMIEIPR